ncbi:MULTISPECIES: hypothetical protein [Chryseobacterium]|uniref:hypothetical protein n=1 Tax=Chryseobacterium TaxID=59732 RepID=UPI00203612B1|nr:MULTISPECIES: hypothetical protein [Chryseobacterium]
MKKELFINLIGMTRYEVGQEMGYGLNRFEEDVWNYEVGKTWLGKRIILTLTFKDDKASELSLSKSFKKR